LINSSTGDFQTDDGFVLGPATTEQAFLASSVGQSSKDNGHNDGWSRYWLPRPLRAHSIDWACHAAFLNGALKNLSMSTYDPASKGWADWSEAKELLKKKWHDDILMQILGVPPYHYSWGEVASAYDPRSASADIAIRYS
jgi:hypothetical protein